MFFLLILFSFFTLNCLEISFFNKKIEIIRKDKSICNFNTFESPLLKHISQMLVTYSNNHFICINHCVPIDIQEEYIKTFFIYVSAAEVLSCTSKKYYAYFHDILIKARYELAYLLHTQWLPQFTQSLDSIQEQYTNSQKKFVSIDYRALKISLPFVAHFMGYFLAQNDYQEYNPIECMLIPCINKRALKKSLYLHDTTTGRQERAKNEMRYMIHQLIIFCFIYEKILQKSLNKKFIFEVQNFTKDILKSFLIHRNTKDDLPNIRDYLGDDTGSIACYTKYSDNNFDQDLNDTSFWKLITQNNIYLIAQNMGEGIYVDTDLTTVESNNIRRFIVCPGDTRFNRYANKLLYFLKKNRVTYCISSIALLTYLYSIYKARTSNTFTNKYKTIIQ